MESAFINGIELRTEVSENYVQINDIQGEDLAQIWEPLTKAYPGFELCLCFRNMPAPVDVLAGIGAYILDDCLEMRVTPQEYKPHNNPEITLLTKDDFAEFAALHDVLNSEESGMYWTSRRIWNKWDGWRIFVVKADGKIIGYGMIMVMMRDGLMGEIFCVEADSPEHRKALISAMAGCAFDCGKEVVLYMVDREGPRSPHEYDAATAVGFRETGYYTGYQVDEI